MKPFHIKFPHIPIEFGLIAGFMLLTFRILWMIEKNPNLLANATFMQLVTTITTGGLLLAASHYFQRERGQAAQDRVDQTLADKIPPVTGEAKDGIFTGEEKSGELGRGGPGLGEGGESRDR